MVEKQLDQRNLEKSADRIENNFVITFSTVNGSGSITANTVLLRAISRLGIPVSGKNIFPSNIQGMPTWYTLRVNSKGFLGRVEMDDIIVAMNPATFTKEFDYLVPGGVMIYADDIEIPIPRKDVIAYPIPVRSIIKKMDVPRNLRIYLSNMVYVGVLVHLLQIPLSAIEEALAAQFKNKEKPIQMNLAVILDAKKWAEENLEKRDPFFIKPNYDDKRTECILVEGNTAAALGAIFGGVQYVGWYPITPATSMIEALHEYLPKLRKDPVTQRDTCVVLQAEDEIAAIGMAVGAGWAGLRAMTATSGPGMSLMTEYLGMAYYVEIPVVVWDVQRVGPSTGLPTRTSQGDLTFAYFNSHGDTEYIILIPGTIPECFEFAWKAFDLAEKYQTPVIVLSDLDLGMNHWVSEKFEYPNVPMNRGKVLWEEELQALLDQRKGDWGRYLDIDGDGIPYRTVPGNKHRKSAYFTRGTGHDEFGYYREDPEVWEKMLNRIKRKLAAARHDVPLPVMDMEENVDIGIITMGSVDQILPEVRDMLMQAGIKVNVLRIRAVPFSPQVEEFINHHQRCYVVEMNRDGQLRQLLILHKPEFAEKLIQLSHIDGLPVTANWVVGKIIRQETAIAGKEEDTDGQLKR